MFGLEENLPLNTPEMGGVKVSEVQKNSLSLPEVPENNAQWLTPS